ncbi:STYKc [Musa troglodytarum]|uniref:STYKc n=1 Tax=Musa troglodytarum TaxID=320322 RepID=A0A9E7F4T7_9LILI|nr:STYKc [Musa troglodytarum]
MRPRKAERSRTTMVAEVVTSVVDLELDTHMAVNVAEMVSGSSSLLIYQAAAAAAETPHRMMRSRHRGHIFAENRMPTAAPFDSTADPPVPDLNQHKSEQ